jgi:cbb3-type cytochrome oxidase subunit 3
MRLKTATTASALFCGLLLLSWPWAVGSRPAASAGERALNEYALRLMGYFLVLVIALFLTAVFAWLLMRQIRREYAEQRRANFQDLMESTLSDHAKRPKQDES